MNKKANLVEHKVGDIVFPKIGPHKDQPHKVIHIHDDGSLNITPTHAGRMNKYHLGAAKATPDQVYHKEETEPLQEVEDPKAKYYEPKPEAEKRFWKKHIVQKHLSVVGNGDDVYGATNIKKDTTIDQDLPRPQDRSFYEMTEHQKERREHIVKAMKKHVSGFKKRYGNRAKNVMYATAMKMATEEVETIDESKIYVPNSQKHNQLFTRALDQGYKTMAHSDGTKTAMVHPETGHGIVFFKLSHGHEGVEDSKGSIAARHIHNRMDKLHGKWSGDTGPMDEERAIDETIKVGDSGHLGFGTKGGAGFKGKVMKLEGDLVHIQSGGPVGKFGPKTYKGPLKNFTKD